MKLRKFNITRTSKTYVIMILIKSGNLLPDVVKNHYQNLVTENDLYYNEMIMLPTREMRV